MKNIDTEQLRKDAEALRLSAFNGLNEDHRCALAGRGKELLLLFYAARIVITMPEDRIDPVDTVIDRARQELNLSEKGYARLPKSTRAAIKSAVEIMIADHQPMPPMQKRGPLGACPIEVSETSPFIGYEIKARENGVGEWTQAWRTRNVWNGKNGSFIAYNQFVDEVRIPAETIHRCVKSALDTYSAALPEVGEEQAHARVRDRIRATVDRFFYSSVLPVDTERHDSWWRVHDAIHGGYLRFRIHLDVAGPDVPAAA